MAYTVDLPKPQPIELAEFVESMETADLECAEDLCEVADLFGRLNANKRLLVDHVNEYLSAGRERDARNTYTGQTFVLAGARTYFVRANVWLPPNYPLLPLAEEGNHFFYGVAHDHNFSFLTAGHVGSGYRTRIFEHDGRRETIAIGKTVEAVFLEETTLPEGKMMVFRASQDIHTQFAPQEFSISLNLMMQNDRDAARTQYLFDEDCRKVVAHGRGADPEYQNFLDTAALVGDSVTHTLLADLAEAKRGTPLGAAAASALDLAGVVSINDDSKAYEPRRTFAAQTASGQAEEVLPQRAFVTPQSSARNGTWKFREGR